MVLLGRFLIFSGLEKHFSLRSAHGLAGLILAFFMMKHGLSFAPPEPRQIKLPPGRCLQHIAGFLFTKRIYERVFSELIADMESEYLEALHEKQKWKSRWVWVRGVCGFWLAFGEQLADSVLKRVWALLKLSR